jgi:phage portal protein BeeE
VTQDQFARLKSELETSFQGAKHGSFVCRLCDRRPLLLEGGLDWKPLSMTPKDMDFIEAKNSAAREIALAIGVPPMLLGIALFLCALRHAKGRAGRKARSSCDRPISIKSKP